MAVFLSLFAGAGQQFFTNAGVPLAGGKIFTYGAGGSTPQATYTTSAGNIAHSNPIVLDASGRVPGGGEIWLTNNLAYKFVLQTSANVTIQTLDNVGGGVDGASLAASSGSSLIGFIQSGSGAVARTVQSKLRDIINAFDFGAVADNVTDNTAAIQSALNALPTAGGTVQIPAGCRFNIKSLTFRQNCNLEYYANDDTSQPGPTSDIGSGELIYFSANSSYPSDPTGAAVNEWRYTAAFHPGVVIDARKDIQGANAYLRPGQSLTNPVRASLNYMDEQTGVGRVLYESYANGSNFSSMSFHAWRNVITLNGIGTAAWVSVPTEKTVITGTTSGAKGFLISVSAGATTVLWFSGRFVTGETVSDNNETTTATITSAVFATASYSPIAQGMFRGNWAVGLPADAVKDMFVVGGKIATTRTRGTFYEEETILDPGIVWVDSYESTPVSGFEIIYDTSVAAASRRLYLTKYNSTTRISQIGGIQAYCGFTNALALSASSFNVASVTKNGTGDYTINFINAAARADFTVSLSTEDPLQYAYVFAKTTGVVRIRIVTTGTSTLVDATGTINVQCLGGDI